MRLSIGHKILNIGLAIPEKIDLVNYHEEVFIFWFNI